MVLYNALHLSRCVCVCVLILALRHFWKQLLLLLATIVCRMLVWLIACTKEFYLFVKCFNVFSLVVPMRADAGMREI